MHRISVLSVCIQKLHITLMVRIISGDHTGLIKVVTNDSKEYGIYGEQSLENEIKGLCWCSDDMFLSISRIGRVNLWGLNSDGAVHEDSLDLQLMDAVGMRRIDDNSFYAYSEQGQVSVCGMEFKIHGEMRVVGPISASASCSNGGIAFGGRENDLQLYNIGTQQSVWKARNVPHDKLNLRVPVWVTDIKFLTPEKATVSDAKIYTGTGHKHVRLYDVQASNQPVISMELPTEFRVTCIQPLSDGNSVYVADTAGGLYLYDIRTQRRKNTLSGFNGSIRDMHLSSADPGALLACVSLDRHLRVYSTKTNKQRFGHYLKNKLNCCLIEPTSDEDSEADEVEGDDDVLEEMDDISDDDESQEEEEEEVEPRRKKPKRRV